MCNLITQELSGFPKLSLVVVEWVGNCFVRVGGAEGRMLDGCTLCVCGTAAVLTYSGLGGSSKLIDNPVLYSLNIYFFFQLFYE